MKKEIGSEFWNIPLIENENSFFNDDIKWVISGRAALDLIIKDIKKYKNIKTASLPSWCCESMIQPFINNNIEVAFYPVIFKDNKLYYDIDNLRSDVLLKIDYFGYETTNVLYDGLVINDVTHSLFTSNEHKGDYVFGSLRKWTGIKTGGFVYKNDKKLIDINLKNSETYYELRKEAMEQKSNYIEDIINNKDYLKIYGQAEEMLDRMYDYDANINDINDAKHLDIGLIKNIRQENAKVILKHFKDYAMFKSINNDSCPLFVPIIVPNEKRDELRKYLISNNIYCPVHWPISELHKLTDEERYIYDNELSLICDQRYNREDMEYMCKHIEEFFKENKC